jgi:hypothetical protein
MGGPWKWLVWFETESALWLEAWLEAWLGLSKSGFGLELQLNWHPTHFQKTQPQSYTRKGNW